MAGEEAEYKGVKMYSDWVRRPVPLYMAVAGPKSQQIAGECMDTMTIQPTFSIDFIVVTMYPG